MVHPRARWTIRRARKITKVRAKINQQELFSRSFGTWCRTALLVSALHGAGQKIDRSAPSALKIPTIFGEALNLASPSTTEPAAGLGEGGLLNDGRERVYHSSITNL